MQPLNLYVDPRQQYRVNSWQLNNPYGGDIPWDPSRYRPPPVKTTAPGGEWYAKPLPQVNPTGNVNPTPVSPTLTPRPLTGPVIAPPVAKRPMSPRGIGPGTSNLGPALQAAGYLPLLWGAAGDAAGDFGRQQRGAFDSGRRGPGGLALAYFASPLNFPAAATGFLADQPRPKDIPPWLWPFPDPPGPNDTDPRALDDGPEITPATPTYGPPAFTGGQGVGVLYNISYKVGGSQQNGVIPSVPTYGPISGLGRQVEDGGVGSQGPLKAISNPGTARDASGNTFQIFLSLGGTTGRFVYPFEEPQFEISELTVTRADGLPDQFGNGLGPVTGSTDPVRGLNPARQATAGKPRPLPSPFPPPAPTDLPWPQTPAQPTPDTTPLAPPAPTPNFNPTPTPNPQPPTQPGTTPTPTDLDAPRPTPPNLGTDPLTPPAGGLSNPIGGNRFGALRSPFPSALAVAIPVVLLAGLRQRVNTPSGNLLTPTQPNPNVVVVTPPPTPTVPIPKPPTCAYERQRMIDIQKKATDVQQKASNPVSGFPGLYALQIEARTKLGQMSDLLGNVNQFMRKAWETTRMQKVLDVLTFVGVMHNVSMLSRDIGETFFYLIAQGLDIVGIENEEGGPLDIGEIVGSSVNNFLISVFGEAFVEGARDSYRKANRIVQSASMVIWTIRSIQDSSLDLMEWLAESTGKIGNALKRFGVVGERAYPWMSERAQAQHRMRNRFDKVTGTLERAEDVVSSATVATSGVLEIQQETGELFDNFGAFRTSVLDAVPDPWLDNNPVNDQAENEAAASSSPPISAANAERVN